MTTATEKISNTESMIDSRDVIARIAYLEELLADEKDGPDSVYEEEFNELRALKELASEAESSSDWHHGETLIHEDYFKEHAEELARDIGAISGTDCWPLDHIDWDAAADALKADYIEVWYGDQTYYIHA